MSLRAACKLFVLSLLVFAAAFALRRVFLWDVMAVSWDQEAQSSWALGAAFLLRWIENIASVIAAMGSPWSARFGLIAGGAMLRRKY